MRLITRYLLKEYLRLFAVVLPALATVFLVLHFLEKIRRFSEHDAALIWILQYFVLKSPKILLEVMPLAILLSTLFTLVRLSKNNELLAFMGAGIGLFTLTRPILLFSLLISLLGFHLNGTLIPYGLKTARAVQEIEIERRDPSTHFIQSKVWLQFAPKEFFYAREIDPSSGTMQGIHLYTVDEDFSLKEEITAKSMTYANQTWTLASGIQTRFLANRSLETTPFIQKNIPLNRTPEDFRQAAVIPTEMTDRQLQTYIQRLTEDGINATRYEVDLQARGAFSVASFIMAFIGIPFSVKQARQAGSTSCFAVGIVIGISYWVISSAMIALGYTRVLSSLPAAWGGNLFFLLLGIYLWWRLESA